MKTLSIRQPWAWLIIHGGKDIENRTWYTNIRERIAIHAGRHMTVQEYDLAKYFAHRINPRLTLPGIKQFNFGGIIGEVDLIGCVDESSSPWFAGPWGFVLANPEACAFRPCRGHLGFFET